MGFLWLSSAGRDADFRFYTVYFEHQSLEGLQVGSAVNMRGITVGRVESYQIEPDNINRVKVLLRVERADAGAREHQGLGQPQLRHRPGAHQARHARHARAGAGAVAPGERYPVIPEGTSGFDQITDSASRLAASADTRADQGQPADGPGKPAGLLRAAGGPARPGQGPERAHVHAGQDGGRAGPQPGRVPAGLGPHLGGRAAHQRQRRAAGAGSRRPRCATRRRRCAS